MMVAVRAVPLLLSLLALGACMVPERSAPPVSFAGSERDARILANEDAPAPTLGDFPQDPTAPPQPSRCIQGGRDLFIGPTAEPAEPAPAADSHLQQTACRP